MDCIPSQPKPGFPIFFLANFSEVGAGDAAVYKMCHKD